MIDVQSIKIMGALLTPETASRDPEILSKCGGAATNILAFYLGLIKPNETIPFNTETSYVFKAIADEESRAAWVTGPSGYNTADTHAWQIAQLIDALKAYDAAKKKATKAAPAATAPAALPPPAMTLVQNAPPPAADPAPEAAPPPPPAPARRGRGRPMTIVAEVPGEATTQNLLPDSIATSDPRLDTIVAKIDELTKAVSHLTGCLDGLAVSQGQLMQVSSEAQYYAHLALTLAALVREGTTGMPVVDAIEEAVDLIARLGAPPKAKA